LAGVKCAGARTACLQVFQEAVSYYCKLQEGGQIERFDAYLLDPHGGDLAGFFLLHADRPALDTFRSSAEFQRLLVRAGSVIDNLGLVSAYSGDAMGVQMALFGEMRRSCLRPNRSRGSCRRAHAARFLWWAPAVVAMRARHGQLLDRSTGRVRCGAATAVPGRVPCAPRVHRRDRLVALRAPGPRTAASARRRPKEEVRSDESRLSEVAQPSWKQEGSPASMQVTCRSRTLWKR